MRILIFFLIPFYLFADYLYYPYIITSISSIKKAPFNSTTFCEYYTSAGYDTVVEGSNSYCHYLISGSYYEIPYGDLIYNDILYSTTYYQLDSSVNKDCLYNSAIHLSGNLYKISSSAISFCSAKKGYTYDKNDNIWVPTSSNSNATPICPGEKIYNPSSASCVNKPKCPKNVLCSGPGKILDPKTCVCKCEGPLVYNNGECVPNTDLNKSECEAQGGIYLHTISVKDFFSDPKYAFLIMQVPLFTSHLCYTQDYLTKSLNKIKDALSPKKVLTAALTILPIGKLKYVFEADELADEISNAAKNPKVLQDEKPVIATKYNPKTGTYEPIVNLKPRNNPLAPNLLLQAPTDTTTADDIVSPSSGLNDFLNSPFVTKGPISTPQDLTDAVTEFNIDNNLRTGTESKIAEDLREIFKRSKPEEKANFPITIKDNVGEDEEIPAQVQRSVTPVPNTPNAYNVEYVITPEGASKPVTINYYITQAPASSPSGAPAIIAKPTYELGSTKYIGKQIIINNSAPKTNTNNKAPTPSKSSNAAKNPVKPNINYNSFVTPTQNAITTAFNYKISLFTCPNVSPRCPNGIQINWNNMGIKGKYKIPDPTCAVIKAINNPKISPLITSAGNIIVLLAGILGSLSLFRRD